MLVLSRKPGERVLLRHTSGEEIRLTNIRVGPNSVRLGIEAGRDWDIVREELLQEGRAPVAQGAA